MSVYHSLNEDQTKTLLAILIHTSKVDHTNHFNEIKFIKEISRKLNVMEETLVDLRNGPEGFQFDIPEQENERMMIFIHVIHIIRIDSKISRSEINYAHQVGLILGLNPLLIKDLIDGYQNEINTGNKLSEIQLAQLIKKYLN